MHVLGRALPAELRMPCPARPFAVAGRAAPALPDPGQRLLGAGEARQGQGPSPWSYYSLTDVRPFFMAGLWSEVLAPATGEVGDAYTLIITDANAIMRVDDRMPVIPDNAVAQAWVEPGPLPAELLVPHPAAATTAWWV